MNKNIFFGIGLLILIAAIFVISASTGYFALKQDKEIVIGSIMPLSGDAASFGTTFQATANFAVSEINQNGGINGKELKIIFEDSKCSNKDAIDSINKLINIDGVKIVIGGICSGETLGAAPIAEDNKVILFSPGSGSTDITNAGDYIFRNMASDAYSGEKIAQAAINNRDLKIAIITENTEYPTSLSRVFTKKYTEFGGTIVIEEKFSSEETDFKTIITKVISKNPDAIYLNPQTPKAFTILLKQLKEVGYTGRLYGNEYTRSKEVMDGYLNEVEGIIFAEAKFNENDPDTKAFLDKLKDQNIDLSYPSYQTKVYDSIYIIKEAIDYCNTDKNTECIKEYLYSIKDRKGVDGYLTINKDGDAELDFELKIIKNGEVVAYNN